MTPSLLLASRSPRRQHLLRVLDIPFQVLPVDLDETPHADESPYEMVKRLSAAKARSAGEMAKSALVIGADTTVVLDGVMLAKPDSPDEAREMLGRLSGRTHCVLTGVCVYDTESGDQHRFVEQTDVTFGQLPDELIEDYIASNSPYDKAGGYGIQDDRGMLFVERINGDFYNVMGLPVYRLNSVLRAHFSQLFGLPTP